MRYTLYIQRERRLAALFAVIAASLTFAGCNGSIYSNFREVAQLQVVQTLGLDTNGHGVDLTVSTGQGLADMPAVLISRPGESILTAMKQLQIYSGRDELYYSHTRYALLGESAARSSLGDFFGFLERSSELRLDTALFVVKSGTAKGLMSRSGEKGYEIGAVLSSIQRDSTRLSDPKAFSCREIIRSVSQYGSTLVCAVSGEKTEGFVFSESGEISAIPWGYGIIKNGALVGYLDLETALGANILLNQRGLGRIALQDSQKKTITVGLKASSAKYSAVWENGKLKKILVHVTASAALDELEESISPDDLSYLDRLSAELSENLQYRCGNVLSVSRQLGADFLGIRGALQRKYPEEIFLLDDGFANSLKNAKILLTVDCSIVHTYDMGQPENVGGPSNG